MTLIKILSVATAMAIAIGMSKITGLDLRDIMTVIAFVASVSCLAHQTVVSYYARLIMKRRDDK